MQGQSKTYSSWVTCEVMSIQGEIGRRGLQPQGLPDFREAYKEQVSQHNRQQAGSVVRATTVSTTAETGSRQGMVLTP